MNPSHSWVAPEGGKEPVFGTNPIAFAWPRPGGVPFVFDFATSAIARGDIELHAKQGKAIPPEWAIDADGRPTTDPKAALQGAMRTFGGHKGSALAAMVELLGGALIGDMTSRESMDFDEGVGATPCHGELVIAFDPKVFLGDDLDTGRARRADVRIDRRAGCAAAVATPLRRPRAQHRERRADSEGAVRRDPDAARLTRDRAARLRRRQDGR